MSGRRYRGLIKISLKIDEPWAVGGVSSYDFREGAAADEDPVIYLPILTDPRDRTPHIPATSLVGALWTHLSNPERWLGSRSDGTSSNEDKTIPSPVRALGARLDMVTVSTRTTTAIDPARRAAEAKTLRTEELVDSDSSTFVWWLQLDYDDDVAAIDELAGELWDWTPIIGRRRSAGRGRARVTRVERGTVDLHDPSGLTWWLQHRHRWLAGDAQASQPKNWGVAPRSGTPAAGAYRKDLRWSFEVVDPLHLGMPRPPRTAANHHPTREKIPGSSWRGIFRHRVAHIQRVRGDDEDTIAATRARLFGTGRASGSSVTDGHRGALTFFDAPIRLDGRSALTFTHVAIDRITGGARQFSEVLDDRGQGALFTVEAIPPGSTVDLVVRSDMPLDPADEALLDAVISDLDDAVVGVGAMTSRGYGTLKLLGKES